MSGPFAPEPALKNPLPPSEQKRRTWLVVLVIILAFILIGIVSCVTLTGTADKAINEGITKASTETSKSQQAKDDRNARARSRQARPLSWASTKRSQAGRW